MVAGSAQPSALRLGGAEVRLLLCSDGEGVWGSLKARVGVSEGCICRSTGLSLAVSQLLSPALSAPTRAMRAVRVLLRAEGGAAVW